MSRALVQLRQRPKKKGGKGQGGGDTNLVLERGCSNAQKVDVAVQRAGKGQGHQRVGKRARAAAMITVRRSASRSEGGPSR